MLSFTEENYLKAIYLVNDIEFSAGTNEIAHQLSVAPATANNMLKKLHAKELLVHERYGKNTLTDEGKKVALRVLRKHRLWETFLFQKLNFNWAEVHDVAEQLEHIVSSKLVDELDKLLGFPKTDPHGDAIPDKDGNIDMHTYHRLSNEPIGSICTIKGVIDSSKIFLEYLSSMDLAIDSKIKILSRNEFDGLTTFEVNQLRHTGSRQFAENVLVEVAEEG